MYRPSLNIQDSCEMGAPFTVNVALIVTYMTCDAEQATRSWRQVEIRRLCQVVTLCIECH